VLALVCARICFLMCHSTPQHVNISSTQCFLQPLWHAHLITQEQIQHACGRMHSDRGHFGSYPDLVRVQQLLDEGVSPREHDISGMSCLQYAGYHGHVDVLQLLLCNGADVNQKDMQYRDTALHDATANSHLEAVHVLLEHGADWTLKNKSGVSPLDRAANNSKDVLGAIRSVGVGSCVGVAVWFCVLWLCGLCCKGPDGALGAVQKYLSMANPHSFYHM